jgi:hypothetical protein
MEGIPLGQEVPFRTEVLVVLEMAAGTEVLAVRRVIHTDLAGEQAVTQGLEVMAIVMVNTLRVLAAQVAAGHHISIMII